MPEHKVFCLGFQKTGTSSIGLALTQLGYSVAGYNPFRPFATRADLDIETLWQAAKPIADQMDAAQDTPWPILYPYLDEAFPDAKFIHVVRDREDWMRSVLADFGKHHNEIHRLIYGSDCPTDNEAGWMARYDRHNREVPEHFAGRPDSFVSLNMSKGEVNWTNLCAFLGHPVPDQPWPHANKISEKRRRLFWAQQRNRARRWIARAVPDRKR